MYHSCYDIMNGTIEWWDDGMGLAQQSANDLMKVMWEESSSSTGASVQTDTRRSQRQRNLPSRSWDHIKKRDYWRRRAYASCIPYIISTSTLNNPKWIIVINGAGINWKQPNLEVCRLTIKKWFNWCEVGVQVKIESKRWTDQILDRACSKGISSKIRHWISRSICSSC